MWRLDRLKDERTAALLPLFRHDARVKSYWSHCQQESNGIVGNVGNQSVKVDQYDDERKKKEKVNSGGDEIFDAPNKH